MSEPRQVKFFDRDGDATGKRDATVSTVGTTESCPRPDDDELVYEASTDSDEPLHENDLVAEEVPLQRKAEWTPIMYKRPIVPVEGEKYCPPAMTGSSLASFHSHQKLVLFGGVGEQAPNNTTWVYCFKYKRWECIVYDRPAPEARSGHCTAVVNGTEMILFGGADISTSRYFNDVWSFDVVVKQWTLIEPVGVKPRPRWAFAMAAVECKVYVHGGESPSYEVLGDLHVYEHDPYGSFSASLSCPTTIQNADVYADYIRDLLYSDADKAAGEFANKGLVPTCVQVLPSTTGSATITLCISVGIRASRLDIDVLHSVVANILGLGLSEFWGISQSQRGWLPLRTIYPAPPPRMLHVAVVVKDAIVIVGGSGSGNGAHNGPHAVWVLGSRSLLWREFVCSPASAAQHSPHRLRARGGGEGKADEDLGEESGEAGQPRATDQLPTPFHVSSSKVGSLTGHTACAYANCVVVHGGKLNGKACGEATWCLDLPAATWRVLEVCSRSGERDDESKVLVPLPRWRHCAAALVSVDATRLMRECRSITPGSLCYPLGREHASELRGILSQERQELKNESASAGLLVSKDTVPHLVITQGIVMWGGQTPARKTSELWRLTIVSD